jgi:hypothetical protein
MRPAHITIPAPPSALASRLEVAEAEVHRLRIRIQEESNASRREILHLQEESATSRRELVQVNHRLWTMEQWAWGQDKKVTQLMGQIGDMMRRMNNVENVR